MRPAKRRGIGFRLTLAVVLTALVPLLVAIPLADNAIRNSTARFFVPEIRQRLDQSLELYNELAKAVKGSMRHQAAAISLDPALRAAVAAKDQAAATRRLEALFPQHAELVALTVMDAGDEAWARKDRGRLLDDATELGLRVVKALDDDAEFSLHAEFATRRERYDQLEQMGSFVAEYARIEERRAADDRAYLKAFAFLLGITILASAGVGIGLARGVSGRLSALARATRKVGAGDFSVRVERQGNDELTELGAAFNLMVEEIDTSRARIEYLRRVAAWQEMARRLAHEIKNPLTPIQLAVQEIHQRYDDARPEYRRLLDVTLEVVEAEVGTLRRLVSEFSEFARLPEVHVERVDVGEYLCEQAHQLGCPTLREPHAVSPGFFGVEGVEATLEFDLGEDTAALELDPQMFRRVLVNLIRNAVQAMKGARGSRVRVSVEVRPREVLVHVDDDGPGVPAEMRDTVFDPYVTTKDEGTGLGLAIVKKVIIEHGGRITIADSPQGGARVSMVLPRAGERRGGDS